MSRILRGSWQILQGSTAAGPCLLGLQGQTCVSSCMLQDITLLDVLASAFGADTAAVKLAAHSRVFCCCLRAAGSTQQHWPFPAHKEETGYAYILTHPGIPCVLWEHFFDSGKAGIISELTAIRSAPLCAAAPWPGMPLIPSCLRRLISHAAHGCYPAIVAAQHCCVPQSSRGADTASALCRAHRRRNGINARSSLEILCSDGDMYLAKVDDRLMVKLGPRYDMGDLSPGEAWKMVSSGKDFAVWERPS